MRALVFAALVLLLPARASARSCEFWGGSSPDATLAHTKNAGIGSLRGGLFLANGTQSWNDTTFAPYDQAIALAYESHISFVALINSQSIPNDPGVSGWNAPPTTSDGRNAYVQQFVDTTKLLMSRYGDRVKYWEIWNEPNHCNAPDDHLSICDANPSATYLRPSIFAKILAETYVQNHDLIAQKGLHIVLGGIYAHDLPAHYVADDYLRALYGDGVWAWMGAHYGRNYPWDAFAFHIYTTLWQPGNMPASTIQDFLDQLASVRATAGDPYPLFITEFGWQVNANGQVSEAQQAADVDTSLAVYESRAEVARTYVFRISEWQGWGIYRSDWSATPAVSVYQQHTHGCTPTVLPPLPPADMAIGRSDGGASDGGGAVDDAGTTPAPDASASTDDAGGGDDAANARGGCAVGAPGAPIASGTSLLLVLFAVLCASRKRSRIALIVCALGAGCGSEDLTFPKSFLFGSAIAGFQAEMGCPTIARAQCEDAGSDWYTWVTKPELVNDPGLYLDGDPPSSGPGFFELYPQDLDRATNELHHNAFRLSIEWSRLFPTATDGVTGYAELRALASTSALAYYHALFAALKARGLVPMVTLDHYTLPSWIHDAYGCHQNVDTCTKRGWLDHDRILSEIAKYAGFVAQEFGAEIDLYATLNEPLTAVVLTGYLFQSAARTNPPGVSLKTDDARAAMTTMIEAHARMYDAIKAADTSDADGDGVAAEVGLVYNLQAVAPDNPADPQDQSAVKNLAYLENQAFLDGVGKGDLDSNLDGMPTHRDDLANRLDFLGINYYARTVVQGTPSSFFPSISPLLTFDPLTLLYDYQYPKGIYEVLSFAKRYGVPMYISETGVEDSADTGRASAWLVQTLTWVKRAIADGMPVKGYFYWTLTDNYEWNHGMSVKMGLYAVDPADATKTRHARGVVATYGAIAQARSISGELAAKYPTR